MGALSSREARLPLVGMVASAAVFHALMIHETAAVKCGAIITFSISALCFGLAQHRKIIIILPIFLGVLVSSMLIILSPNDFPIQATLSWLPISVVLLLVAAAAVVNRQDEGNDVHLGSPEAQSDRTMWSSRASAFSSRSNNGRPVAFKHADREEILVGIHGAGASTRSMTEYSYRSSDISLPHSGRLPRELDPCLRTMFPEKSSSSAPELHSQAFGSDTNPQTPDT